MTTPNGTVMTYSYGSSGETNDLMSRVASLTVGGLSRASYGYAGQGWLAQTVLSEHDTRSELYSGALGNYPDLDRFNRVI